MVVHVDGTSYVRKETKKPRTPMPFPVQEGIEVRGGCVWLVLCGVCQDELSVLFLFVADGAHEFVALSVDVDDFHIGVVL